MVTLKRISTNLANTHNLARRNFFTKLFTTSKAKKEKRIPVKDNGLLNGKVALVTGGHGGIGLACIKEMLKNDLQAVMIADLNPCKGVLAVEEISKKFGPKKASFIQCDVTNPVLFDWAFKHTIKQFKRVDILVNSFGMFNEKQWEREIAVNLNAYIIGCRLGMQYMSKEYQGKGGTIVNIFSTMALEPYSGCPIYATTQCGILGLTRALGYGDHYEKTWVKVMGLCPGFTSTDLLKNASTHCLNETYSEEFQRELELACFQDPCFVGKGLIRMLRCGESASIWVVEDGNEAVEVHIPTLDKLIKPC